MTYKLTKTSLNPDPYYGAVSLLLSGDGANNSTDIRDSSRNTKAISVAGNAKISTAQSKFNGSSLSFSGLNPDSLSIADGDDFEFGTGDFTIEAWIYSTGASGFDTVITKGWGSNSYAPFAILLPTPGILRFYASSNSSSWDIASGKDIITSGASNTWYHIAVTREGNTFRTFANGVVNQTWTSSLAIHNNTQPVTVGSSNNGGFNWEGYIDDLRVTKGVARYTSNFTPPTQPFLPTFKVGADPEFYNTSLLLHGDGTNGSTTITDSSPSPKTVTASGNAQISTAQSKFGGSSILFDGSSDYLATNPLGLVSTDFTIEFWVYLTAGGTAGNQVICTTYRLPTQLNTFIISRDGSTNVISFTDPVGGSSATSALATGTWHHIACTYTHSSNTFKIFANGVGSSSATGTAITAQASSFYIGGSPGDNNLGTAWFSGYIDDLRITKGVVRYTSNFTPPTQPFPNF